MFGCSAWQNGTSVKKQRTTLPLSTGPNSITDFIKCLPPWRRFRWGDAITSILSWCPGCWVRKSGFSTVTVPISSQLATQFVMNDADNALSRLKLFDLCRGLHYLWWRWTKFLSNRVTSDCTQLCELLISWRRGSFHRTLSIIIIKLQHDIVGGNVKFRIVFVFTSYLGYL